MNNTNIAPLSPLGVKNYKHIVILTGAGVSVASGLPTYRGPGGLWEKDEIAKIVNVESIPSRLPELWALYSERRRVALSVGPNPAHSAIADLQKRLPGRVTLLTQNIDELHQRGGSPDVVELHGSGFRSCCSNSNCTSPSFADEKSYDAPPVCAECGAFLRPAVTLFGENLPVKALYDAKRALRDVDLFLAIGTSGSVWPAADFVKHARYAEAKCYAINLEKTSPHNPYFHSEILGKAEELLPVLLA
jgi:NAD-dependent deacetylase